MSLGADVRHGQNREDNVTQDPLDNVTRDSLDNVTRDPLDNETLEAPHSSLNLLHSYAHI